MAEQSYDAQPDRKFNSSTNSEKKKRKMTNGTHYSCLRVSHLIILPRGGFRKSRNLGILCSGMVKVLSHRCSDQLRLYL
jgi:hypothetical protein